MLGSVLDTSYHFLESPLEGRYDQQHMGGRERDVASEMTGKIRCDGHKELRTVSNTRQLLKQLTNGEKSFKYIAWGVLSSPPIPI